MRSSNKKALTHLNGIKANIDLKIIEELFGSDMDPSDSDLERRVFNAIYKRHPFPTAFIVTFPTDVLSTDGTIYVGITGELPFMSKVFGIKQRIGSTTIDPARERTPAAFTHAENAEPSSVDPRHFEPVAVLQPDDYAAPDFEDLFEAEKQAGSIQGNW